jgi:hypothetical protein
LNLTDVPGFLGEKAQGTWFISVWDLAAQDYGTLHSWSLTIEHPPDGLSYQDWTLGFPGLNLANQLGDSDGDRIPNLIEFLIAGCSPLIGDTHPTLQPDPTNSQYLQFVIPLRPDTEGARLAVDLATTLGNPSWAEAVTNGDSVIVDQSVPGVLKVRLKKLPGAKFLRLKAVPN